ncbi:hypothetical protein [uncultured Tessaracoccus sp.]|uniref:hypothetical protein n=1 Tax=uncultured Tessaracoccus sp. TaxID=905023 RepID=UPI0025D0445B|nr:hypothetical protein [uncultured Tessaracoccus sp.]
MTETRQETSLGRQLLLGAVVHVLCLGATHVAAFLVLLWGVSGGPHGDDLWLQLIGIIGWLGTTWIVWEVWGRRTRTLVPLLAGPAAAMLLVSANVGQNWPAFGGLPLDACVRWALVSPVPIVFAWLALAGSKRWAATVHVVSLTAFALGLLVRFAVPGFVSVARSAFLL